MQHAGKENGSRVLKEPREIISVIRPLKSGSQTYATANMPLSCIVAEEELMNIVKEEVAVVCSTFSAHFVVAELYSLYTYWRMPMVGCVYPYDDVEVGCSLVHSLGVRVKRTSPSECSVTWGGDAEYVEPCTTIQEYLPF